MACVGIGLLTSFLIFIYGTFGEQLTFHGIQGCEEHFKSPDDANETSLVMTSFECVRECGKLDWCASVNVCPSPEPEMLTCAKLTFQFKRSCDTLDPAKDCTYLEKVFTTCFNGGTYVEESKTCLCIFGFTGDQCERYYYDCSEAYQRTMVNRGKQWLTIKPKTSPRPFTVYCSISKGGYTYMESRKDGCDVLKFGRTWEELKQPIMNSDCSYWLGLENIHYMTSQTDYLLDIHMSGQDGYHGHPAYANFRIGNETNGYKMTYGSFSYVKHPAEDAFSFDGVNGPLGHPFATMDRPDAGGCALSQNAAWWYGQACPDYNLHLPLGSGSAPQHAIWRYQGQEIEVKSYVAQLHSTW